MSFASSVSSALPRQNVEWASLLKSTPLSTNIQAHLVKVYSILAAALVACALGVVADMKYHLGGNLSSFAGLALIFLLAFDSNKSDYPRRIGILCTYGFLQGLSMGTLIAYAIQVDPAIIFTAFAGTATIFVCFSLSAMYSQRRSYLYLGGIISSSLLFMAVLSLVSIFYASMWMFSVQLYLGLLVFCLYVLYDTQLIIEKAETSSDYVGHALELFIDFIAIFIRIVIILIQNSEKKEEKKSNNRR